MINIIGNYIGHVKTGGGTASPPFSQRFWQDINQQWQNITDTWN